MRKPVEVNTIEKAEIVSMRRMRARRRLGLGDAGTWGQKWDFRSYKEEALLRVEPYSLGCKT